jgi:hypothetical protein
VPESKLPTAAKTLLAFSEPRASQRIAEPDSIPPNDPAEWRKPFAKWLDSVCVRNSRCFGGVACLHIAFCEWEAGRGGVPCNRDTFELLLKESGFLMGEVAGVVLVSGLTFREDAEAVGLWPASEAHRAIPIPKPAPQNTNVLDDRLFCEPVRARESTVCAK